jgi:hypothetical protein
MDVKCRQHVVWECLCICLDDLAACSKDPKALFDTLTGLKHKCKLKGIAPIKFHLSGSFGQDVDCGMLLWLGFKDLCQANAEEPQRDVRGAALAPLAG